MIINRRSAALQFTTDAVAGSLRATMSTSVPALADRSAAADGNSAAAPLDLAALYPALYAVQPERPTLVRLMRPLAFRLSVVAAAVIITLFHLA
jgi:hypothetical protein